MVLAVNNHLKTAISPLLYSLLCVLPVANSSTLPAALQRVKCTFPRPRLCNMPFDKAHQQRHHITIWKAFKLVALPCASIQRLVESHPAKVSSMIALHML